LLPICCTALHLSCYGSFSDLIENQRAAETEVHTNYLRSGSSSSSWGGQVQLQQNSPVGQQAAAKQMWQIKWPNSRIADRPAGSTQQQARIQVSAMYRWTTAHPPDTH
jgi:hypothetical protein